MKWFRAGRGRGWDDMRKRFGCWMGFRITGVTRGIAGFGKGLFWRVDLFFSNGELCFILNRCYGWHLKSLETWEGVRNWRKNGFSRESLYFSGVSNSQYESHGCRDRPSYFMDEHMMSIETEVTRETLVQWIVILHVILFPMYMNIKQNELQLWMEMERRISCRKPYLSISHSSAEKDSVTRGKRGNLNNDRQYWRFIYHKQQRAFADIWEISINSNKGRGNVTILGDWNEMLGLFFMFTHFISNSNHAYKNNTSNRRHKGNFLNCFLALPYEF